MITIDKAIQSDGHICLLTLSGSKGQEDLMAKVIQRASDIIQRGNND